MSSGAVEVELDRQGRVLVPSYLREYAGLTESEVVVVGALNRLEIWASTRWQPYRSQIEDAAGGTRRAPRRPGHLTVPRPLMRLPGRSARRPTHEVHGHMGEGHLPVLVDEVVTSLAVGPGSSVADCTVGGGGHAERLLEATSPDGRLLGIDADRAAISEAKRVLAPFGERVACATRTSSRSTTRRSAAGFVPLDAVLFDLGLSSYQLADPDRGFSFAADAPPDMRFDETTGLSALELIDRSSERELAGILATFGEERRAGRIAKAIVAARAEGRIVTARGARGARGRRCARRVPAAPMPVGSIRRRAPSRRCASR